MNLNTTLQRNAAFSQFSSDTYNFPLCESISLYSEYRVFLFCFLKSIASLARPAFYACWQSQNLADDYTTSGNFHPFCHTNIYFWHKLDNRSQIRTNLKNVILNVQLVLCTISVLKTITSNKMVLSTYFVLLKADGYFPKVSLQCFNFFIFFSNARRK